MSISEVIQSIEREMYINAVEKGSKGDGDGERVKDADYRESRRDGENPCKRKGL